MFPFFPSEEEWSSSPSPSIFSSNCNTNVSLEKPQGVTALREHMAHGPAH